MNEYNERLLKNVLEDLREEQDDELRREMEEAKNDPEFQLKEGEAEAFAKKYVPKKKKNTKSIIFKAAAVFIVLAVGFSTFVPLSVQGQKQTVAELIANFVNSEFVAIGNENLLLTYEGEYVPTFIPNGYEVKEVSNLKDSKSIIFINSQGNTIVYSEKNIDINIDNEENATVEEIEILGYKGIYTEKDGKQQIAIKAVNSLIHIFSNDTELDLINFAKYIEKR